MNPFLLSLLAFMFLSLPAWSASNETFTFGRFGKSGRHFDGNYQAITEMILREANVTAR